jgi:hypothetical protein
MAQTYPSTCPDINAGTKLEVDSADALIGINRGTVLLTKGTAAAMTLAAPTAGQDDGKELRIIAGTANAHTVTITTSACLNGVYHIFTFAGYIGNTLNLVAYNGVWYTPTSNATAATGGTLS